MFLKLSLARYEPELVKQMAIKKADKGLDLFQELSDKNNIIIGIGVPTKEGDKTEGLLIYNIETKEVAELVLKVYTL